MFDALGQHVKVGDLVTINKRGNLKIAKVVGLHNSIGVVTVQTVENVFNSKEVTEDVRALVVVTQQINPYQRQEILHE